MKKTKMQIIKEAIEGFNLFNNISYKLWKTPAQTIPRTIMEKKGAISFHVKNNETEKSTRKKIKTDFSEVFCPKLSPFNQTSLLKRKDKTMTSHSKRTNKYQTFKKVLEDGSIL